MSRFVWVLVASLLWPQLAWADGGVPLLRAEAEGLALTVFASPSPIRAGPLDLSVMVQESQDRRPILDAKVGLRLLPGAGGRPIEVSPTRAWATNRLFYAVPVDLPKSGRWIIEVDVEHGSRRASARGEFVASEGLPPLLEIWPYWILPILAVGLFALHQWRSRSLGRLKSGEVR